MAEDARRDAATVIGAALDVAALEGYVPGCCPKDTNYCVAAVLEALRTDGLIGITETGEIVGLTLLGLPFCETHGNPGAEARAERVAEVAAYWRISSGSVRGERDPE